MNEDWQRQEEPVLSALRLLRRRISKLESSRRSNLEEAARLRLDVEAAHEELGALAGHDAGEAHAEAGAARRAAEDESDSLKSELRRLRADAAAVDAAQKQVDADVSRATAKRRALAARADAADAELAATIRALEARAADAALAATIDARREAQRAAAARAAVEARRAAAARADADEARAAKEEARAARDEARAVRAAAKEKRRVEFALRRETSLRLDLRGALSGLFPTKHKLLPHPPHHEHSTTNSRLRCVQCNPPPPPPLERYSYWRKPYTNQRTNETF